jgi:hypothetical protein
MMVVTKGPNENRRSVAFSIEGNSGMNSGDLANPTAFVVSPRFQCRTREATHQDAGENPKGRMPLEPLGGSSREIPRPTGIRIVERSWFTKASNISGRRWCGRPVRRCVHEGKTPNALSLKVSIA